MDVKERLIEEVKLRAFDDRYIDKEEEKDILQVAIQLGVGVDQARNALKQVCDAHDYALESALDERALEMLQQFAGNDGVIDKKEFEDTVGIIFNASKQRLSQVKCQKKVKKIVLEQEFKIKQGLFSGGNWFSSI